jgi:hypothetical protein
MLNTDCRAARKFEGWVLMQKLSGYSYKRWSPIRSLSPWLALRRWAKNRRH